MEIRSFTARFAALFVAVAMVGVGCSSSTAPTAIDAGADPEPTATVTPDDEAIAADNATPDDQAIAADNATPDGHQHQHSEMLEVAWSPVPTVTLEVTADPISGWNLHAVPTGHRLAPEHASTGPIEGEGHMHLYVDGVKVARLYGEWYHLAALEPGDHEVRVELSANNHSALAVDGVIIDATTSITETAGELVPMDDMDDMNDTDDMGSAQEIVLSVAGGTVTGGGRHDVDRGAQVTIRIVSDIADEMHVHGYDLFADLTPGVAAEITFGADLPGVWEVELEDSGLALTELAVR